MRGLQLFALIGQAAIGACSIDGDANHSTRCDEVTWCAMPQICYRGFCVDEGEVPAIDVDASARPAPVGDASAPTSSATSVDAGASEISTAPSASVPAAASASDAGRSVAVVPPAAPNDAAAPPVQVDAPPAQVTPQPTQTSTPPAPVAQSPGQPAVAGAVDAATADAAPSPAAPSAPVEPPTKPPAAAVDDAGSHDDDAGSYDDDAGSSDDDASSYDDDASSSDDEPRGRPGRGGSARGPSPLLACVPACATRSVFCLACLRSRSGGDSCDEKEQRANPSLRELCDFLCSPLGCEP